jgi:uncharacterized protein (TIGR03435 family)
MSSMKKVMLWMIAFVLCGTGALRAQTFAGDWQGTLKAGKDLRIVTKISKDDKGAWKAVMYSIDQGGQALTANTVAVDGPSIKFGLLVLGATYEGKLGADGNSITGTFTQANSPLPLNFVRATKETAWVIPEPPAKLPPMAADAHPVFDVATIKPSKPDAQGKGFGVRGRKVSTFNTTLIDLVEFAYDVQSKQIVNAPAWMETDHYDISGQPDLEGQPSHEQLKEMMQKLLADRFKLTFHRDKKELAVFAMTVAKTGLKLKPSEQAAGGLPGLFFHPGAKGGLVFTIRNATMHEMVGVMQAAMLDRPVADQTGLTGRYDGDVTFTPDDSQMGGLGAKLPPPPEGAEAPPPLFSAYPDQLGLKIEATRAPVEVLVLDHVEKPSED